MTESILPGAGTAHSGGSIDYDHSDASRAIRAAIRTGNKNRGGAYEHKDALDDGCTGRLRSGWGDLCRI